MPSFVTSLKALLQLGIEPLALNSFYKLGLKTGYYKRVSILDTRYSNIESSTSYPKGNIVPLFNLPSREQLLQTLGNDGKTALVLEADEIINGTFRMFGGGRMPIQLTFDEPLNHWTDYENGKAPIPYSPFPIHDIKFLWEPARFGWAFALGRAYAITQDEKYAEAFWKQFDSFTSGNPPYLGPHWMNGQEVAIRLLALVWCAHVFKGQNEKHTQQLVHSIAYHAARIPPTLIYARSQNNNHLVTEAAALYTAGIFLNQSRWRDLGWHWLNNSLRSQISSYGEYIQHSTNYHRLMLQTALWADMVSRANHQHWSPPTLEALTRASHWMFSMIDPASGQTPNLGANDGALIFPLSQTPFDDFRPTVQAAARAFLRTSLPSGIWDEMSLWFGLSPSEKTADSNVYMSDHLRGKDSWAYLRASRFKSRLSHIDQLHFDLWRRGLNIAQDAGTYLYNSEPPWDNPLVSTRVHNTITIDDRDQMTRGGRFLTLDWFPAYSKSLLEADEKILGRVLAYHKGYQKLGIRHERIATVFTDEHWEIQDRLIFTKPGEHLFRLHWLLRDGEYSSSTMSETENRDSGIGIRIKLPDGWMTLHINLEPSAFQPFDAAQGKPSISLVRAGELIYGQRDVKPYEGWSSPTYGTKVPALSLAVEVRSSKSFSFVSEFIFPK